MTIAKEPYFLNDPDWYAFDEKECRYILKPDAPPEAVKSYQAFYADDQQGLFYKNDPDDVIWWMETPGIVGEHLFSFDRVKVFNLFADYPHNLTPEQKEIFDRENPDWFDFFSDRQ